MVEGIISILRLQQIKTSLVQISTHIKEAIRSKWKKNKSNFTGIRTLTAGSKVHHSTNWAIGAEKKIGQKYRVLISNMYIEINLNSKVLLNKKFSNHFGENFCFIIMGIGHLFSYVNFFLSTFLQALYLVTQMVFFQKG